MTFAKSLGSAVSEAASEVDFAKSEPVFGREKPHPEGYHIRNSCTVRRYDYSKISILEYLDSFLVSNWTESKILELRLKCELHLQLSTLILTV